MAALQGLGSVFFLGSLGQTSAANALLILATAPFLAALLSWLALGERIDRATILAIAAVFAGVAIIGSGSIGGGTLLGDGLALANAVTLAGYYVVLRKVPERNMIVPIALGYLVTSAIAWPLAPMEPLSLQQAGLIFLSGGVILAGGVALLMLGPRYLPAAEVSMITMLEIVVGPLLVWAVLGEEPPAESLIGGAVILAVITAHAVVQLRRPHAQDRGEKQLEPAAFPAFPQNACPSDRFRQLSRRSYWTGAHRHCSAVSRDVLNMVPSPDRSPARHIPT
jgi:drug/metabolite transporter (DMT)-like permease